MPKSCIDLQYICKHRKRFIRAGWKIVYLPPWYLIMRTEKVETVFCDFTLTPSCPSTILPPSFTFRENIILFNCLIFSSRHGWPKNILTLANIIFRSLFRWRWPSDAAADKAILPAWSRCHINSITSQNNSRCCVIISGGTNSAGKTFRG